MLKKILGTAGARLINALLGFSILIVNTNKLGTEGVGTIGLIILSITIILLLNNFVGGGALIYLIPRIDLFKLFIPSYIWAVFSAISGTYILKFLNLIPVEYTCHILLLSLIQTLSSINLTVLLGNEKIKQYNIISVIQMLMLFLSLSFFIFFIKKIEVISYVYSLYIAYLTSFVLSLLLIKKFLIFSPLSNFGNVIKQIFKYGSYVQFANIIQLLNYRLSYYVINGFIGRAALGIYTAGNQLSEGLWLVGKSVSMVQYTKISNAKNEKYGKKLTLSLLKFTFTITFILVIIILLLPEQVFGMIFSKEFTQIKPVILSLSIGIIAIAISMMYSHFFSGTGRHYHNTISSAIGLVFTLSLIFILVPKYGITGAGITASISYTASAIYQHIVFIKITKTKLSDFFITKKDILFFFKEIKILLNQ